MTEWLCFRVVIVIVLLNKLFLELEKGKCVQCSTCKSHNKVLEIIIVRRKVIGLIIQVSTQVVNRNIKVATMWQWPICKDLPISKNFAIYQFSISGFSNPDFQKFLTFKVFDCIRGFKDSQVSDFRGFPFFLFD